MKILLQKDALTNDRLLDSIKRGGHEYQEVTVIPFTEEFLEQVQFVPDAVFGSVKFVEICRKRGYPTFKSFGPVPKLYPSEFWLNCGEQVKWGEIKLARPMFIKPFKEKWFVGQVVNTKEDLQKIQLGQSDDEYNEPVYICETHEIEMEYRFFIINGKIATGSSYKPVQGMITRGSHMRYFVDFLIRNYGVPDTAFAMDIAWANDYRGNPHPYIVELNNFNAAGVYKSDTDLLLQELEKGL
jgi:hypothetical protein